MINLDQSKPLCRVTHSDNRHDSMQPSRQSSLKERLRSMSISSASSSQPLFDPSQPNSSNISSAPSSDLLPTPALHPLREAEPAASIGTSPFAMARPPHDGLAAHAAHEPQQAAPAQVHYQDENGPTLRGPGAFQNGAAAPSRPALNGPAENGTALLGRPLSQNGAAELPQPPPATSHISSHDHPIAHQGAVMQQQPVLVTEPLQQSSSTGSLLTSGNVARHAEAPWQASGLLQPSPGQHHGPPPLSPPAANDGPTPSADRAKSPAPSSTSSPSRPSSPVPSVSPPPGHHEIFFPSACTLPLVVCAARQQRS